MSQTEFIEPGSFSSKKKIHLTSATSSTVTAWRTTSGFIAVGFLVHVGVTMRMTRLDSRMCHEENDERSDDRIRQVIGWNQSGGISEHSGDRNNKRAEDALRREPKDFPVLFNGDDKNESTNLQLSKRKHTKLINVSI